MKACDPCRCSRTTLPPSRASSYPQSELDCETTVYGEAHKRGHRAEESLGTANDAGGAVSVRAVDQYSSQ